ncbi:MAG: hypothetical protein FWK01_16430 [Pantanalinema sp. GBBB05]|nr:hypothetical protein [Pantanalinema sp. GBBB05]
MGDTINSIQGIYPFGGAPSEQFAVEEVKRAMILNPLTFVPTCEWVVWEDRLPEGSEYVDGSFACTEVVFEEPPPKYEYLHTTPPQTVSIKNGKIHLRALISLGDFTTHGNDVLSEIENINNALVSLHEIVNRLGGTDRAEALTKFRELVAIVEGVTSKMTRPILDKSATFVQFAKDYHVGNSTTRIFGVTCDVGYTHEEVMENIKFSLNNPDIAYIKLKPTSKFIEWQDDLPEGSEYIEDSFTCTGVIYPSFHEVYMDLCPKHAPLEEASRWHPDIR